MPSLIPVLFGAKDGERLRLDLRPPADGEGWIRTGIEIRNGPFFGTFETSFRDDELMAFRNQLRAVYNSLASEAHLRAVEGCLSLDVAAARHGTINVRGCAKDNSGSERRLQFGFDIDKASCRRRLALWTNSSRTVARREAAR